jgi:hypothetical protein
MCKVTIYANHRMLAKNMNKTSVKMSIEQILKILKRKLN